MAVSRTWVVGTAVNSTIFTHYGADPIFPYSVDITAGALPAGCRVNAVEFGRTVTNVNVRAVVTGTPTKAGGGRVTIEFRVRTPFGTLTDRREVLSWTVRSSASPPPPPTVVRPNWTATSRTYTPIAGGSTFTSFPYPNTGTSPITFTTSGTVPSWVTLDLRPSRRRLTLRPTAVHAGQTYRFNIIARNSAGSDTLQIIIQPRAAVVAPTRTVSAITHYLAPGRAFSTGFGTTSGTAPFTVSATGQPSWVTSVTASGASGTAPTGTGTFTMTVTFRNAATGTAVLTVTYVVSNALVAPAWTDTGGSTERLYRYVAGQRILIPPVDNTPFPSGIAYSMRSVMAGMRFDPSDRQVKDIAASPVTGPTRSIGTGTLTARVNWVTSIALQITPPAGTVEDTYSQPYSVVDASGLGANFAVTSRTVEWLAESTVNLSLTAPTGTPTPSITTSGTLPSGVSFSTSALRYSGTAPSSSGGSGTHTVTATNTVRVYNPQTGRIQNVTYTSHHVLSWSIGESTEAPNFGTVKQSARQQWLVGSSQTFTIPDPGGNPTATITHDDLPTGFSFDDKTRVLTVTVPNIQGEDSIAFTATNPSTNETDTYTFRYNIYATAGQPLWSPSTFADTAKFTFGYDCAFYLHPVDTGGDPQPTYTYVSGAPAGMAWDETLGEIGAVAGKPTSNDTTGQMLFRANSTGGQGELRVNWAVSDDAFPVWGLQYAISGG